VRLRSEEEAAFEVDDGDGGPIRSGERQPVDGGG